MKNLPTGLNFANHSLLARQRGLKGRIAKSTIELGLLQTGPFIPTIFPPTLTIVVIEVQIQGGVDKQTMEDHLRTLVLRINQISIRLWRPPSHLSYPTSALFIRDLIVIAQHDSYISSIHIIDRYSATNHFFRYFLPWQLGSFIKAASPPALKPSSSTRPSFC